MLGLPKATEVNKLLPKKAIYAKFQMNTAAKDKVDEDISRITIVNELSPARVNLAEGENVKSFFVMNVSLKKKDFSESTVAMVRMSKGAVVMLPQESSIPNVTISVPADRSMSLQPTVPS